jgi:hypothetical protein
MKEVGYTNFTLIQNQLNFKYRNVIENYYESIGKHLSPYFTTLCQQIWHHFIELHSGNTKLDQEAFTNMIRYAKLNNFKDINVWLNYFPLYVANEIHWAQIK